MTEVDLSGLPAHVWEKVWERIELPVDIVRAGAVCRSWRAMLKDYPLKGRQWKQAMPMLLTYNKQRRGSYFSNDIVRNKNHKFEVNIDYDRRFVGSSNGWLAGMNEDYSMTLYKPYSSDGLTIPLPPVLPPWERDLHRPLAPNVTDTSDPLFNDGNDYPFQLEVEVMDELEKAEHLSEDRHDIHVTTVLITADPILDPSRCVVVVVFANKADLAIIRPWEDATWTRIIPRTNTKRNMILNVQYHKDKLYAVNICGSVLAMSLSNLTTIELVAPAIPLIYMYPRYLLFSEEGEMFQVIELFKDDPRIVYFLVYTWQSDKKEWLEVKDVGDMSFFVGKSSSICVPISSGCQPNCIYFAIVSVMPCKSRGWKELPNVGVYHLDNGTTEYFFDFDSKYLKSLAKQPPIWIVPTIHH